LLSDLAGVLESPDSAAPALAQLRRAGQHLVAIAPFGPAFLPPPHTPIGSQVAQVLAREEHDHIEQARRILLRWGVPVLRAGPEDSPAVLLGRIARRGAARRVA